MNLSIAPKCQTKLRIIGLLIQMMYQRNLLIFFFICAKFPSGAVEMIRAKAKKYIEDGRISKHFLVCTNLLTFGHIYIYSPNFGISFNYAFVPKHLESFLIV